MVLRKVFEPKIEELRGNWRKTRNNELYDNFLDYEIKGDESTWGGGRKVKIYRVF